MSFEISYVGGGMLDKIRSISHLDNGRFDTPYMPRFTIPYIVGSQIEFPAEETTIVDKMAFDVDCELLLVAVDTDHYDKDDYWQVFIGDDNINIISKVYSKKYPEGLNFMVAYFIPAGTEIKFVYLNDSANKKLVWYNYQFLMGGPHKRLPVKPEEPPEVTFDPISNPFCYEQLKDGKITITGKITDDFAVDNYSYYANGQKFASSNVKPWKKLVPFSLDYPISVPPKPPRPKVDIVFIIDTSGSMRKHIANVDSNLSRFINKLSEEKLDLYFGATDSNPYYQTHIPLMPAKDFDITSIQVNHSGGWEGETYTQFTGDLFGGWFFPQLREGSLRYYIVVTDTGISKDQPDGINSVLNEEKIKVVMIHKLIHDDYDSIIKATNGLELNIDSADFSSNMDKIADDIIKKTAPPPLQTVTFKVKAQDNLGLRGERSETITFKYCEDD